MSGDSRRERVQDFVLRRRTRRQVISAIVVATFSAGALVLGSRAYLLVRPVHNPSPDAIIHVEPAFAGDAERVIREVDEPGFGRTVTWQMRQGWQVMMNIQHQAGSRLSMWLWGFPNDRPAAGGDDLEKAVHTFTRAEIRRWAPHGSFSGGYAVECNSSFDHCSKYVYWMTYDCTRVRILMEDGPNPDEAGDDLTMAQSLAYLGAIDASMAAIS